MNQPYFIVVLAHSLHGRIRRFHIDQKVVFAVVALALVGCFSLFGFVSSYLRMAWKVANYNSLRQETEGLKARYQKLLTEANQTTDQLAHLQLFASEISVAYGIRGGDPVAARTMQRGAELIPTYRESLQEYNMLKVANFAGTSRLSYARRWLLNNTPSLWPVQGRLTSYFGERMDPLNGFSAFHAGVDISVARGSPVLVAADGIVQEAEFNGSYGRLVVVDHGGGLVSYYAHLSRVDVIAGQEVRRGQVIGASGASGRATAPHLHYEVRRNGNPMNPYHYLSRSSLAAMPHQGRDYGF
jgi:murein DD-endopeptidase MepM/ murein hydrolase activator NlpD